MDEIAAISALADPVRKSLYEFVAAQPDAVGREAAAEAAGVPLHSARFHLDKLVEVGLLEADSRRLTGRTGPGAGRPARVYRRSDHEVSVSVPARGYDLVGEVLAAAVEQSMAGAPIGECLVREAHGTGLRDGAGCDTTGDDLDRAAAALATRGFEPAGDGESLILRNCPFDALARSHTALVCGVNRDYVSGVIEGLGCSGLSAELDPAEDRCCVRISR